MKIRLVNVINNINIICIINLFFGDDKMFKSEVIPKKKIAIKKNYKII